MKIAMIGQKRIPSREGGVEIVVEELGKRIAKSGYKVVCFNRRKKFAEKELLSNEIGNMEIRDVFTISGRGVEAFTASFFASLKASFEKFDVVHYHAEGPALMCFIPKLFKRKVVVTIHGLDWQRAKWNKFASKLIKYGEKMAVRYADEIIVLSENIKQYFLDTYNRECTFIPNGITEFKKVPVKHINEKWGLEKDEYILFLGRIVPEKGIDCLIEAYKSLKTDKKLVIAGKSGDCDKYFDSIKEEVGKTPNAIMTGFVKDEDLAELFSNAYIYVLPSELEGMPISLLEAMSYGNCCVVSDIPECTSVIEDKGIAFKRSDAKDLSTKLELLCGDKSIVDYYKKNSSEFICSKYNWDRVVEETLKLYD